MIGLNKTILLGMPNHHGIFNSLIANLEMLGFKVETLNLRYNLTRIDEFLAKPYMLLPSAIYEKYGFENWVKYILDILPYIPFNLPES
ncbi:MAG: hypothetical protein Q4E16_03345 [Neisseria sp.]|nr:hypothetical protein [Neisseria sp.]